jgi:hypothetical protein
VEGVYLFNTSPSLRGRRARLIGAPTKPASWGDGLSPDCHRIMNLGKLNLRDREGGLGLRFCSCKGYRPDPTGLTIERGHVTFLIQFLLSSLTVH